MEICVLTNGHVVVTYNKHRLSVNDDEVFRYAVKSYSHVIGRNKSVSLRKFADLIGQTYAMDARLNAVLEVILKASISMIVTCKYQYVVDDAYVTDYKVIELELFSDLERELLKVSGQSSVEILESAIVACPFVKGTLSQRYSDTASVAS